MSHDCVETPDWIFREGQLAKALEEIGFAKSTQSHILGVGATFPAKAALRSVVVRAHARLFHANEQAVYDASDLRDELADEPPEINSLFEAFAVLSEYPQTLKRNRARGIPDAVTHETLLDLERWMLAFETQHGHVGFDKPVWLRLHFQGNLLSLGRLQFQPGHIKLPYRIYQHRHQGRLAAVAEDGVCCDDQDRPTLTVGKWQTRFSESKTHFSGHAVNVFRGSLRPYAVEFSKTDWEQKLSPGDPVLYVHIPAGAALDPAACLESITRAWDFFDRHFPEISFRAVMCHSWILDPQLMGLRILDQNSNLARFASRFHCLPVPGATDSQFLERIFSQPSKTTTDPISALLRDNSLRRAIAPYLEKGGILRTTDGVFLRDPHPLPTEMTLREPPAFKACIPMPLQIVVDDLGWWCGRDGYLDNEPCRTGISRDHCFEDYLAAVRLGKELGMRPVFATILGEWDTRGRVENLWPLSWVGPHFEGLKNAHLPYERVATLLRESRDSIELGLHGILHEDWVDGKISRSEWHDTDGHPRSPESWKQRLDLFWTLMEEFDFGQFPRSFVPPANRHHFGRREQNFAATLAEYGISTIYAEIEKFVRSQEPSHREFGFDGSTITINRSHDPFSWHIINPEPTGIPPVPVCSMHWPNLLHPDPERNFEVVDRWVTLLKRENLGFSRILSRNTEEFSEQLVHQETTRIEVKGRQLSVDASAFFQFPWMSPKAQTRFWIKVESETPIRTSPPDPRLAWSVIQESPGHIRYQVEISLTRQAPAAEFSI